MPIMEILVKKKKKMPYLNDGMTSFFAKKCI